MVALYNVGAIVLHTFIVFLIHRGVYRICCYEWMARYPKDIVTISRLHDRFHGLDIMFILYFIPILGVVLGYISRIFCVVEMPEYARLANVWEIKIYDIFSRCFPSNIISKLFGIEKIADMQKLERL